MLASAGTSIALAALLAGGALLAGIGLLIRLRAIFADQPGVGELVTGVWLILVALVWGQTRKQRAERALIRRLQIRHGLTQPDRGDRAR
jgi:hypothetical protein